MSHNIEYRSYDEKVNRKNVLESINYIVSHETWQEGGHGIDRLRWLDDVSPRDSYDSAKEYIENHEIGHYDCLAVRYKVMKEPTKALQSAREKLSAAYTHYNELDRKFVFADHSSEFIGCKECGSRIARKYLKSNFCPICHYDMRSDTIKKQIGSAKNKIEELIKKVAEEEKKATEKNFEIRWLVKYEYHT